MGRQRRRGPPGGWGVWGAEELWSVNSRPGHPPEERPAEKGQEKGKATEPQGGPGPTEDETSSEQGWVSRYAGR